MHAFSTWLCLGSFQFLMIHEMIMNNRRAVIAGEDGKFWILQRFLNKDCTRVKTISIK